MPIKHQHEYSYSTQELALLLGLRAEEVAPAIAAKGPGLRLKAGRWHCGKEDLEPAFAPIFALEGVVDRYTIPEALKNCKAPWAQTLVAMYGQDLNFPASLSPEQGEMLKTLVRDLNPRRVLEIGCYTGISTLWIASGLEQNGRGAIVHAVDIFAEIFPLPPWHYQYVADPMKIARAAVNAAELAPRVRLHKMNSREMGVKFRRLLNKPLDLLFIDGDHSIFGCAADFLLFYPHVAVGGSIVLHDIFPENCHHKGPAFVLDKLIGNSPHFEVVKRETTPYNYGMAFIRKKSRDPKLFWMSAGLKIGFKSWQALKGILSLARLVAKAKRSGS